MAQSGRSRKGENTITKTQRFLSFILQHENIYIQRKKGAENHHVIETYKCIILQCPRHLMVTREVLICTSEGHWRGLPVYFTVLIRHQKHSGCQVRMEVLSNKLPLTSKLYCGVNCRGPREVMRHPACPLGLRPNRPR